MFTFQQATLDDAEQIAAIVAQASCGVADHLLDGLIVSLNAASILSIAFLKGEGPYATKNVIRSTQGESITSLLFSYSSADHGVTPLLQSFIPAKRISAARPILERCVPDSLYINTIWVAEELRGSGHSDALMVEAQTRCRALGFHRISLFCWNDNDRAMRFCARHGFELAEHLPRETIPLEGHEAGGSIMLKMLRKN